MPLRHPLGTHEHHPIIPIIVVVAVVIPSIFLMVRLFGGLNKGQKGSTKLMKSGAAASGSALRRS